MLLLKERSVSGGSRGEEEEAGQIWIGIRSRWISSWSESRSGAAGGSARTSLSNSTRYNCMHICIKMLEMTFRWFFLLFVLLAFSRKRSHSSPAALGAFLAFASEVRSCKNRQHCNSRLSSYLHYIRTIFLSQQERSTRILRLPSDRRHCARILHDNQTSHGLQHNEGQNRCKRIQNNHRIQGMQVSCSFIFIFTFFVNY